MSSLSTLLLALHEHYLPFPLILTIILGTLCLLAVSFYRLYLHPLARHPGPASARLTSWSNWYHAAQGDRHVWLHQLHARYGSVVRFAPNSISFNTVSAVDAIYKSRKANVIKSDWYQCVRDSAGGFESTFTARDKARHGVKRRLLSHAFSERALKGYEPRIVQTVRTWLDCIDQESRKGDGKIDLGTWSEYLIFDILGDLCFGKPFGLLKSEEDRFIARLVSQATRSWYTLGYHPLTHALRYVLFNTRLGPYLGGQSYRDNGRFRNFCLAALKERRQAEKATEDDMFHHLLNGRDPETGQSYSMGDLACESVLLMVAGSQSTSNALAAILSYLGNNARQLARLQGEIRSVFASEQEIRYEAGGRLATLPYLRACIDESMRLTPPTPGHLPREVVADGFEVDGIWLPPGTNVGVPAYANHRNEEYFPDASRFQPERFLVDGKYQDAVAFSAFSAGATGCVGKQLAYMELCVAVAMLVWRFDFKVERPGGDRVEYQVKDVFVGEGEGPIVQLGRRTGT